MKTILVFCTLSLFLFSGCAGVKLYTDPSFSKDKETGLKFYYPKPYLLVERNGAKDVPLKTTLLFLPDLSNPVYVKMIRGMGSNEFSIALANGALSTYGLKTDTKVPETIGAVGGLLTGVGGLLTGQAAKVAAKAGDVEQGASVADLTEAKKIVDDIKKDLVDRTISIPGFITTAQTKYLDSAKKEIVSIQILLGDKDPTEVKAIIASMDKLIEYLNGVQCKQEADSCKNFDILFVSLTAQLTKAKGKIQPAESASAPSFELYEIIQNGSGLTYKLVKPTVEN